MMSSHCVLFFYNGLMAPKMKNSAINCNLNEQTKFSGNSRFKLENIFQYKYLLKSSHWLCRSLYFFEAKWSYHCVNTPISTPCWHATVSVVISGCRLCTDSVVAALNQVDSAILLWINTRCIFELSLVLHKHSQCFFFLFVTFLTIHTVVSYLSSAASINS